MCLPKYAFNNLTHWLSVITVDTHHDELRLGLISIFADHLLRAPGAHQPCGGERVESLFRDKSGQPAERLHAGGLGTSPKLHPERFHGRKWDIGGRDNVQQMHVAVEYGR